jgi:two-component system, chemotaxis family, CheB/CheR fusion protein
MARILVIDDDADVLQMLASMVEAGGHTAIATLGGAGAWDALRDAQFDLVVTDLGMPSLDGMSVARWLERHRPGVPVIAVSGAIAELQDISGDSPFAAAIQKPLRRDALLAAIKAVLGGEIA